MRKHGIFIPCSNFVENVDHMAKVIEQKRAVDLQHYSDWSFYILSYVLHYQVVSPREGLNVISPLNMTAKHTTAALLMGKKVTRFGARQQRIGMGIMMIGITAM